MNFCADSLTGDKTVACQATNGGSNPTSALHFERCKLKDVSAFVKNNHYSKTHPGGVDFSFRLLWNGYLAGACLFGYRVGNPKAKTYKTVLPAKTRELVRLVLLDEVPKNSESKFIGWCLRWLKKNTDIQVLVSFADPAFGHSGCIYRASNWIYDGKQKQDRPRIIIDGVEVHPRTAVSRFGTSKADEIVKLGHVVDLKHREPKHRFLYVLREPQ